MVVNHVEKWRLPRGSNGGVDGTGSLPKRCGAAPTVRKILIVAVVVLNFACGIVPISATDIQKLKMN